MSSPFSKKFHSYGKDPVKMLGDLNKDGKMSGWEQARQDKIESNSPGKMLSPFHKEPSIDPCSAEFDYDVATNPPHNMTAKQIREARKKCAGKTKPKQNVKQVREDEDQVRAAAARA